MSETKSNARKQKKTPARRYEAQAQGLTSLRLIAAPNPKDDLSDAELVAICRDPRRSPELIQHLIEALKDL